MQCCKESSACKLPYDRFVNLAWDQAWGEMAWEEIGIVGVLNNRIAQVGGAALVGAIGGGMLGGIGAAPGVTAGAAVGAVGGVAGMFIGYSAYDLFQERGWGEIAPKLTNLIEKGYQNQDDYKFVICPLTQTTLHLSYLSSDRGVKTSCPTNV